MKRNQQSIEQTDNEEQHVWTETMMAEMQFMLDHMVYDAMAFNEVNAKY